LSSEPGSCVRSSEACGCVLPWRMVQHALRRWAGTPSTFSLPSLVLSLWLTVLCAPGSRAEAVDSAGVPSGVNGQETFDCVTGFLECHRAWSASQKAWCLQKEDVECTGGGEDPRHKRSHLMSVGMAWMLLSSVAFVMALFYLVNWPDNDIRRYSWNIISTTISIFTAVLIFQGINNTILLLVPRSYEWIHLFMSVALLLMWFIALNFCIAVVSGANFEAQPVDLSKEFWVVADPMRDDRGEVVDEDKVRQPLGKKSVALIRGMEVFVRKGRLLREDREKALRCWAMLLAHMTGFAAICVGGRVQYLPVFKTNSFLCVVVVFAMQLLMTGLFVGARAVRKRTEALDGVLDARDELAEEYTEEAEIDAASLAVSFLATKAMRFWLTGVLANEEGNEVPLVKHELGTVLSLFGAGTALAVAAVVLPLVVLPPLASKHDTLRRFVDTLQNQGLMTFAWCVIFATQYEVVRSGALAQLGGPSSMGGRVVIALGLSFLAFLAIFGIDKIEDAAKGTGGDMKRVHRLVGSIVNALGILVGFSWELSFEGAVSAVAQSNPYHNGLMRLLLAIMIAMVIIPAWRKYVLEKVMLYRRVYLEEVNARQVAGGWRTGAYEQLEFEDTT